MLPFEFAVTFCLVGCGRLIGVCLYSVFSKGSYFSNFFQVDQKPGESNLCRSHFTVLPGYLSAPTTPCILTSTEDVRRERSFTNYLQIPPSPGVSSTRFGDSYSSVLSPSVLAEKEEPG